MIDLEEFQRRVEQYFQCGQRNEPGGRIILDLLRALRVECAKNEQLRAENERLCFQREGLLCRVAELRAEIELVSK